MAIRPDDLTPTIPPPDANPKKPRITLPPLAMLASKEMLLMCVIGFCVIGFCVIGVTSGTRRSRGGL